MQSMIGFLRPRPIINRKNRANNAGGKNLLTAEVNDESKIKLENMSGQAKRYITP